MILTVPLQPGTVLANVRYKWIIAGTEGLELSDGITQPDTDYPVFRFNVVPPLGAEEMIVFDAAFPSNWNVAGYKVALASSREITMPTPPLQFGWPVRSIPFQQVVEGIVSRHGLDPKKEWPPSLRQALSGQINARVRTAWRVWPWPELTITEERAFRTIWTSAKQFYIIGMNGKPDEVFYLGDGFVNGDTEFGANFGYYKVGGALDADPPVGTLPTNTDYWEPLTPVDTFIELNQMCKRPIGVVYGVYAGNPRVNRCVKPLDFMPSEKGIDVLCYGGPTVFVKYQVPPPKFNTSPFMIGKNNAAGAVVYFWGTGECYQSMVDNNTAIPTDTNLWRRLAFPEFLEQYVVAGAYSDGLRESDQSEAGMNPAYMQVRGAWAKDAEAEAQEYLQYEIDALSAQGLTFKWNFHRRDGCCCCSPPWTGGSVTTLTDICETDPLWPPTPTPAQGCDTSYHHEVVAIHTADGTPSLEEISTLLLSTMCTKITIAIDVEDSPEEQVWRLDAGTADPDDPGQVQPDDYDAIRQQEVLGESRLMKDLLAITILAIALALAKCTVEAGTGPINYDTKTHQVKKPDTSTETLCDYDFSGLNVCGLSGGGGTTYNFIKSITLSVADVSLVNDESAPGNSKYYGTDSGGTKGFFDLPASSGGTVTSITATPPIFVTPDPIVDTGTIFADTEPDAFIGLTDVPTSYTGQANKLVTVKGDESGLEFTTITTPTTTPTPTATPITFPHAVTFVVDGAGIVLTTGTKNPVKIPYGGTLVGWLVEAKPSGSVTADIFRSADAAGLPVTSIVGGSGTKPFVSSNTENSSTSFTSWTSTTLTAKDNLAISLSGISTSTYVAVTLYYQ